MEILNLLKKYNQKIAIVDNDGNRLTTYHELDCLADKLCAKLKNDGIKDGSRVILKFDRTRDFIISIFAVLKLNAVFISVLKEYPDWRIDFIKKDSNATIIITNDYLNDIDNYNAYDYNNTYDDKSAACIIYTSGSTGNPKGIIYDRKGLDAIAKRNTIIFDKFDTDEVKWGAMSPFSFVAALYEILIVLNVGGTLHILSNAIRNDINSIEDYYENNKLTCGFMPPRILKEYHNKDKYLKKIIVAGEKLTNFYTDEYEVYNLYGQSEALPITFYKVDKQYDCTPIGRPFPDSTIYLLDDNGNEVDKGEKGEICVVGNYSLEYVGLEEKTKSTYEKLADGKIRIHTGDIGMYDEDGNLLYIDRKDYMIKFHGQRIEPGEIEKAINEVAGIKSSIVKAFENADGTMTIAAFYTANEKVENNIIIEKISKKLPNYMIPSNYIYMEEFPLNQNGKIDRKILKLPSKETFLKKYVEPNNELQEKLCYAFEKIFNIEKVGIEDNFYELGGNSLNALKIVSELNLKSFTSQMVLEGATVKEIANIYSNRKDDKPELLKSNNVINECDMSYSQIYQYEICKCTNQPLQNMAAVCYYKLPKNTNIEKLKNAIYKVVNENKIYNICADLEAEKIYINDKKFEIYDTKLKNDEFEEYRLNKFTKVRDYKKDFLFEVEIITVDNNEKYLRLYMDHLLYDGVSFGLLLNEISNNYKGIESINSGFNIFDAIQYEKNIENTDFYNNACEFYDTVYKGLEQFKLLKMKNNKITGGKQIEILKDIEKKDLDDYFAKHHISALTYFMFVLDLSIRKYFDTNNFTYMNIYNGRYDEKLMKAHGCFAKGVFIKSMNLDESNDIETLLKKLQNNYQKTVYYDVVDFKKLLSKYKNIRSGINFNYKENIETVFEIENEKLEMQFLSDIFKCFKLYVDMDISLSKSNNKYFMMVNTTRLDDIEVQNFVKIYDQYCHSLLKNNNINSIGIL